LSKYNADEEEDKVGGTRNCRLREEYMGNY